MIKAVVFDLDGTLLNTLEDLNNACNYALNQYGYEPISLLETQCFIGNGIAKLIERSLKGKMEKFPQVLETFKVYYANNCNNRTKPYLGIKELLLDLQAKKVKLAVLSNKAQFALDILVASHFSNIFDLVVGDRLDIIKKPNPMGLKMIAAELNLDLADIIYVGDSLVDVETVKNAGCQGLFVTYGFGRAEELAKVTNNLCINVASLRERIEKSL